MQEKIDELERLYDIKLNEVEYYKGELERAGIESTYSESAAASETGDKSDYYDLFMKEKEKVKTLIIEQ